MFCRECGKELGDADKVCAYCGTFVRERRENAEDRTEEGKEKGKAEGQNEKSQGGAVQFGNAGNNHKGKGKFPLILLGTAALALAAGAGVFVGRQSVPAQEELVKESRAADGEGKEDTDSELDTVQGNSDTEESGGAETADSEWAKMIAKCNSDGSAKMSINVFAENYAPGARNLDYAWDKTLFYTLEDISPDKAADGRINGYAIERKMLKNAVTGNKIEYEIYRNPANDKVNKIVSIEYFSDHLEVTDYYYDDNGKISFIFVRNDANYVPSYAVPMKDGQRYYFSQDCMTKWRTVAGGVQTNYVLGQASASVGNNAPDSVFMYSNLPARQQEDYNIMERRMINAAYNTYHTVLESSSVSEITGYVYNEAGEPLDNVEVALCDETEGDILYMTRTDENGLYQIIVPAEEYTYQININYEGCAPVSIYGIKASGQVLSEYQNSVYMMKDTENKVRIQLQGYDALNYAADGTGMERLSNASVLIREGINNKTGRAEYQGVFDVDGQLMADLKPGMYTAEVTKTGYDNTYYNFAAKSGMNTVRINVSPKLASGEVRAVLTWGEEPFDLDSHLFTPYDSAFGDSTYHIWYGNKADRMGDNLDVDDTDSFGPETMTIPVVKNGLYKYYVADFTNCSSGNPLSYDLSDSGATVNVYTSDGLAASFAVPSNRPGVIWEVFEIRNGVIVPTQRYYSNIDDKNWWHSDK